MNGEQEMGNKYNKKSFEHFNEDLGEEETGGSDDDPVKIPH